MVKQKSKKTKLFQVKIVLNDAPVPIWRRLVIGANTPLELVHEVFQIAMGWSNYHLHSFIAGTRRITDSNTASTAGTGRGPKYEDEVDLDLIDLLKKTGDSFVYQYDFGDNWMHSVVLENVLEQEAPINFLAHCITGKRACPPEEVGGVLGYAEFLNSIEDPEHPGREEHLDWVGCVFEPEAFDARLVNLRIQMFQHEFQEKFAEVLQELVTAEAPKQSRAKLAVAEGKGSKTKK